MLEEISEGECYRQILTHVLVQVTKVRWLEGFTGLVYWETIDRANINGVTTGVQEAQHFVEDFYLVHVNPAVAEEDSTPSVQHIDLGAEGHDRVEFGRQVA